MITYGDMEPMPVLPRIYFYLFLLLLLIGAAISIEWLTYPGEESFKEDYKDTVELEGDGRLPEPFAHTERRMFILLVDCMSYETATDPDRMPYLNQLQNNSTYGYMQNSIDAVTAPSIKAAFTGRDTFSMFNVFLNWKAGNKVPSVFTQLAEAGVTISVYSDVSFKQFGDDITDYNEMDRSSSKKYPKIETETIRIAMDDYLNGEHDIVIMHMLTPHDVVHKIGPFGKEYYKAFKEADNTIKMVDEAISENETFLVMGDHGHDKDGRHSYGLDVPTYFSIRGPGFERNNEEKISITDVRFFASWAMGLPLPDNYEAGTYPSALISRGEIPPEYATEHHTLDHPEELRTEISTDLYPHFILTVLHMSILMAIWLVFLIGGDGFASIPIWKKALVFVALTPLFFPKYLPYSSVIGLIVLAPLLITSIKKRDGKRKIDKKNLSLALVAIAGSFAFLFWGYLFLHYRGSLHSTPKIILFLVWPFIWLLGLLITKYKGPRIASWITLSFGFFIFFPTVHGGYGWPGTLGPIMIGWAFYYLWDGFINKNKKKDLAGDGLSPRARLFGLHNISWWWLLFPVIFTGMLFFGTGGMNFQFASWFGLVCLLKSAGLAIAALIAKSILFFKRGHKLYGQVATLFLVVLVFIVEIEIITPGRFPYVSLIILLGLISLALHYLPTIWRSGERFVSVDERIYLRNIALLSFLSLLYYYTIRLPVEFYQWADILMAGTYLGALFLKKHPSERSSFSGYIFMVVIAFIISGWVTFAWTIHRIEWFFLYDWVGEAALETYILFYLPAIIIRYAIPMLMLRVILSELFKGRFRFPRKQVLAIAGLKLFSLIMIFYGIGLNAASSIYFEAVQEAAIILILILGLL